jgi:ATP-dependent helicase/nuclease subunit B
VLADQSDCPFRAFARHRLFVGAANEPQPGEDPRTRGTLVHYVLEHLWRRLKTSAALQELTADQRHKMITAITWSTIRHLRETNSTGFGLRFDRLEVEVIVELIERLLQVELQRSPFQVQHVENKLELLLGELVFSLRIDRIDQLDNGGSLLIDYKTGQIALPDWSHPRLVEPQLPAYAIGMENHDVALSFVSVNAKKLEFKGVAGVDSDIKGVSPMHKVPRLKQFDNWPTMLEFWRKSLNNLGQEFANGFAMVSPRDASVCRYCDIRPLCRIGQSTLEASDE